MVTPANKKLTPEQIQTCADSIGVERAALQAVISVETSGNGFYSDGKPVILFEPHIFYRLLTQKGLTKTCDTVMQNRPDLCYPKWGSRKYGSTSIQLDRLNAASGVRYGERERRSRRPVRECDVTAVRKLQCVLDEI